MVDKEIWRRGISQIVQAFEALTLEQKALLKSGIARLMFLKAALHSIVEKSNGEAACAACGGKCCVCGKYHFSAIDLIAYQATGKELFTPVFDGGMCPFLNSGSCLMSPEYRPFNCITFACEVLDGNFSFEENEKFYMLEQELRDCYAELQRLFPDHRMQRSVMSFLQADAV